jgi:hypothetical protein
VVHAFGPDLKPLSRQAIPAVVLASPASKDRDGVYVVDALGKVTLVEAKQPRIKRTS